MKKTKPNHDYNTFSNLIWDNDNEILLLKKHIAVLQSSNNGCENEKKVIIEFGPTSFDARLIITEIYCIMVGY